MKNALGKHQDLKLFNEQGKKVYQYDTYPSGGWREYTLDDKGNILTEKRPDGYWSEYTYDDKGNELTYKDSDGKTRGFNIPEYTMEELVQKLGNFKIKK